MSFGCPMLRDVQARHLAGLTPWPGLVVLPVLARSCLFNSNKQMRISWQYPLALICSVCDSVNYSEMETKSCGYLSEQAIVLSFELQT